jgi:hypothetical protein
MVRIFHAQRIKIHVVGDIELKLVVRLYIGVLRWGYSMEDV